MTSSDSDRHPLRSFERHATELWSVASILTPDPKLAGELVVLALRTSLPDDGLRRLSGSVVLAWLDSDPEQLATVTPAAPTMLSSLHELPAHQRASLALCRFGGHTFRQAADLLDLPAASVADMLTTTLRSLLVAPPSPDVDIVTEQPAV